MKVTLIVWTVKKRTKKPAMVTTMRAIRKNRRRSKRSQSLSKLARSASTTTPVNSSSLRPSLRMKKRKSSSVRKKISTTSPVSWLRGLSNSTWKTSRKSTDIKQSWSRNAKKPSKMASRRTCAQTSMSQKSSQRKAISSKSSGLRLTCLRLMTQSSGKFALRRNSNGPLAMRY